MRSVVVAIVVAASVLLLGACGEEKEAQTAKERAIEQAATEAMRKAGGKGDVTVAGGKMRFTNPKTGEVVEMTLPKGAGHGESGTGESVPEGTWHMKSKEGEATVSMGAGAKIPATFPKDVPLYQGAQVVLVTDQPQATVVHLRTKDDAKTVGDAYGTALKAQGWEEEIAAALATGTMRSLKKGDRSLSVVVMGAGDMTTIQLAVIKEKPKEE